MKLGVQAKVPLVFVPFGVNVAPVGSGAAVNEVMAPPSGSLAVTVKLRAEFSATVCVAGADTVGARSTLATMIWVFAVPDRIAVLAVNVSL